jgi:hypothetical protein
MGFEKFKRPVLASRGVQISSTGRGVTLPFESLTASDVAQTVKVNGVTQITYNTSGVKAEFLLPNPPRAGIMKKILVIKGTSSEELRIHTLSTAQVFAGTTFNTVTIAPTTVNPAGSFGLDLTSVSTSAWAVMAIGSTVHWDFSASTGSTEIA